MLSSFFYGNVLSMLPGGWLTLKYGGKHVLCIVILLSSLLTILTPLAAFTHRYWLVVACRFLTGFAQVCYPNYLQVLSWWSILFQFVSNTRGLNNFTFYGIIVSQFSIEFNSIHKGPCFPAVGQLIVNFVPLAERSRLIGLTFSGVQLGNMCATLIGII